MKKIFFALSMMALFTEVSFAHGGDKPGPHGGYVEMPGAFHTEVVPEKNGAYRVYLSDIEFKNPVVANSEVKLWLKTASKKFEFDCKAEATSFLCSTEEKVSSPKELSVVAKREGAQGNEARYPLPFKAWKK